MPKTVPADVLAQFALACIQPRYLLTLVTPGGTTLRYCTGKNSVTFQTTGGNTYTARGFGFNTIKKTVTLEVNRVQITIDNVDLALTPYRKQIQDSSITLTLVDLGKLGSAANDIAQFSGTAGAPGIDANRQLSFPVLSPMVKLQAPFPNRQLSGPCRWEFNSIYCKNNALTDLSGEVSGTTDAGTTAIKIVDAARTEADGWFDNGVLTIDDGDYAGEERQVSTFETGEVNIIVPLSGAPAAGTAYTLTRRCDQSARDCWLKFNNWVNYGGFKMMPKK